MKSQLETAQPRREQTPGSKNLWRLGSCVLRSDPMEGRTSHVFARGPGTGVMSNAPLAGAVLFALYAYGRLVSGVCHGLATILLARGLPVAKWLDSKLPWTRVTPSRDNPRRHSRSPRDKMVP